MKYTGRKGWQFSRRDVFSLQHTLNPIIAAGLRKFLEEKDHAMFGVPSSVGVSDGDDTVWEQNKQKWIEILEKMVYAFEDKEPEVSDYDFEFYWEHGETGERTAMADIVPMEGYNIRRTNEKEYKSYRAAEDEHAARVQEGLDLFAKHYNNLWW